MRRFRDVNITINKPAPENSLDFLHEERNYLQHELDRAIAKINRLESLIAHYENQLGVRTVECAIEEDINLNRDRRNPYEPVRYRVTKKIIPQSVFELMERIG